MAHSLPDAFQAETIMSNEVNDGLGPANPSDILYQIPLTAILLIIRSGSQKIIFEPFGKSLGVSDAKKGAKHNSLLELAYYASVDLDKKRLVLLAKRLELTELQVQRWWRLRRAQDKPSALDKFCERTWMTAFLCCNFFVTLCMMWDKEWIWNVDLCFVDLRNQSVTNDIWWYYMVNSAFVCSLLVTEFKQVEHKGLYHNLVTIVLLNSSWICNYHRIAIVVLVVHGCAEMFLEAARAARTAKFETLSKILFLTFAILWVISLLLVYPFHVLYSVSDNMHMFLDDYAGSIIYLALLYILMALLFFWTFKIANAFTKMVTKREIRIRSSSSDDSDEEDSDQQDSKNRNK